MSDRAKETEEFLRSLKKGDEIVRPIHNPEAFILRGKAAAAASRGEIHPPGCTHPLAAIHQFIDDDPLVKRYKNPVNLFECTACGTLLWLRDAWGNDVTDN